MSEATNKGELAAHDDRMYIYVLLKAHREPWKKSEATPAFCLHSSSRRELEIRRSTEAARFRYSRHLLMVW